MNPPVILLDFTGAYRQQTFWEPIGPRWIDCSALEGVNGYCDPQAERLLAERISPLPPGGIHFIDSGNYHYMTKLWTDKVDGPFSLVLFDHHPDLQSASFERLLSCGGWVRQVLEENPFVQTVWMLGVDDALAAEIPAAYRSRTIVFPESELAGEAGRERFLREYPGGHVYVSIDKDVLDPREAVTNWDQGTMSAATLKQLLTRILEKSSLAGADICGEAAVSADPFRSAREQAINSRLNGELYRLIESHSLQAGR